MTRILLSLVIVTCSTIACSQKSEDYISGTTQDCFAGKIFHPSKVDVYLLNPKSSPEVTSLLHQMKHLSSANDEKSIETLFALYEKLITKLKRTKVLAHAISDEAGNFSFPGLVSGTAFVVVAASRREDDPAYYAYVEIKSLSAGRNSVTLDFNRGANCTPQAPST